MIRNTLQQTKLATWSVQLFIPGQGVMPMGSGFFVGDDGLFATAAHVIEDAKPHSLVKDETPEGHPLTLDIVDVIFVSKEADFALLKAAPHPAHGTYTPPAGLRVSARELDEGEPVYAYGYPLTIFGEPLIFSLDDLKAMGLPVDELIAPDGRKLSDLMPIPDRFGWALVNHRLSPRTTSAIVASQIEYYNTLDLREENATRNFYVLDKALNYGNSGVRLSPLTQDMYMPSVPDTSRFKFRRWRDATRSRYLASTGSSRGSRIQLSEGHWRPAASSSRT